MSLLRLKAEKNYKETKIKVNRSPFRFVQNFLYLSLLGVLILPNALLILPKKAFAANLAVTNVYVVDVTKNTARIAWDTTTPTNFRILYGPTTSYGRLALGIYNPVNFQLYTTHHVGLLTGLAPNAVYHFCPNGDDGLGNSVVCNGTVNDFTVTTGPDSTSAPELPRVTVDTSMPAVNGQTFNVASDCSNLQTQINAAAAANGNLTHQVVIPAGVTCSGAFQAPPKSAGSGWIIVRTSTPDAQLPAQGTRITPAQQSLMATIQNTGWRNFFSGPASISYYEPCNQGDIWSSFTNDLFTAFDVKSCNTTSHTFQNVPFTSGTIVPSNCNVGDWFNKTNETDSTRRVWYCVTQNKFINMAMMDESFFAGKPGIYVKPGASHYRFVGLEITHAPTSSYTYRRMDYPYLAFVDKTSDHIIFDHNYIHGLGAPTKVANGVQFDGSNVAIVDSYIDNITSWKNLNDVDTESLGLNISYGPGPGKISNNYISTVGINVFFNDEGSEGFSPSFSDYEITKNYFFRDDKYRNAASRVFPNPTSPPALGPAYDGRYYDSRQLLEFKEGRRMLVDGNIFDGNYASVGQGAAFLISPRPGFNASRPDNFDTQVSDITFTNNIVKNVPTGIVAYGPLNSPSTKALSRIKISNNLFSNINGYLVSSTGDYTGGVFGVPFYLFYGIEDVQITHNTLYKVSGTGPALVFGGNGGGGSTQPGSGFVFQDNIGAPMMGGYRGDNGWGTPSLNYDWQYMPAPAWIFDHNVLGGPFDQFGANTPAAYPSGNFFPTTEAGIGFTNAAGGDFSLTSSSPYKSQGTGNSDPGVNMAVLTAATANTQSGGGSGSPPPPTVDVSPTSLNFGSQTVGSTSTPQQVSFTNSGSSAVPTINLSITGDYSISTNYCSFGTVANSHCDVYVVFNPTAGGPRTGTLTFTTPGVSGGPYTVNLTGTGVALTPDITSPQVSITSPSSGTVSGNITFSASANDPAVSGAVTSGLFLTSLMIDGSVVATSTSGSISKVIDTTTLTNASHSLTAKAQDNAGNITTTSATTITVNNAPLPKFPRLVQLTSLEGLLSIPVNQSITATVLSGSTVLSTQPLTPSSGKYTVTFQTSDPQLVDIRISVLGYLSVKFTNIDTTVNSGTTLSAAQLPAGDFNNDNTINTLDYSLLNSHYNQNFSTADINKDGLVNSLDFAILKNNWNRVGQ